MRALITGGAGFIGSHLADYLVDRGDDVVIIDNLSTGRHVNVERLMRRPNVEFCLGTILNADLMDDVVSRCDVVFHLAAAVGVQLILEKPLQSLHTNIRGSEIIFEKAHKFGRPVLVTSTSEIYGKNVNGPLREEDDRVLGSPLNSRWSYSEAKAIDEILAYTYWKEKALPAVIVRLFNTVGPRQTGHYGMVIPRLVRQAILGEPLTVYGDGSQSRCFCYVGDVVKALVALIEHPDAYGKVFNLGGHEEVTIDELARRIINLTSSSSKIVYVPYEQAYGDGFEDMQRRVPDTTRANLLVGFEPTAKLDDVIRMVIEERRG